MSRNLSNLYISESFQYLVQVSGSELETGLGATISGSLLITASLADNATSASYATTAASATSASYALTASYAENVDPVDTGSLLKTASISDAEITFTKGDASTFSIEVNNVTSSISASHAEFAVTASYATFASGAVDVNGVYTASAVDATITFEKGDTTTFDLTINNVTSSISSSYAATATSASYAVTASFALNAGTTVDTGSLLTTASINDANITFTKGDGSTFDIVVNNVTSSISASYATTADTATSASYAATSSYATDFEVAGTITALSASITYLETVYETASVIYSSGSNQFGDASNDTQTLYGTVDVLTGPLNVSGSGVFHNGITGSLDGNAATATSASYATSASQAENATSAVSSSYAATASVALSLSGSVESAVSSSYPIKPGTGENSLIQANYVSGFAYGSGSVMIGGNTTFNTGSNPQPENGAVVIGGVGNTFNSQFYTVDGAVLLGGNSNNIISGKGITVIGGEQNYADQWYAGVIGGYQNGVDAGQKSFIVGGEHGRIRSNTSAIIGGYYGNIYSYNRYANFIGGGWTNNLFGTDSSAIVAGRFNTLYDPAGDNGNLYNSFIIGGSNNYLAGPAQSSGIIASSGSLLSGSAGPISGSVIIGGSSITGSANNTVYVPNLWITGSVEQPDNTVAIGTSITSRGTQNNVLIGYSADAGSGVDYAVAIGSGANAASANDVAIGADASTGGGNSIAIGSNATATSLLSMAIGQGANATDVGAVSIGLTSQAANDSVTVGGGSSTDNGNIQCVTVGNTTISTAQGQVTIGREATGNTGATNAITIGKFATTQANHSQSVAIGYNVTSSAAGGVNINDVFIYNPVTTTNNTVVTNLADAYATPVINSVVTLTQAEYNAIGTPDDSTLYIISGSTPFDPSQYATTGSNNFTGQITGDVSALTPSSNTASLDCSTGNFFTLTLSDGSDTRLEASNITAGQTINLQVTNGGAGTGTISFGTGILQPTGSLYTGSAAANAIDVVSMISFNGSNLLMNSVKQFV